MVEAILVLEQTLLVKFLIVLILTASVPEEHVIIDPALYRPSDIEDIYGDPSKAKENLGWEYAIPFEGLIAALVDEEWKCQETGRTTQGKSREEHALA